MTEEPAETFAFMYHQKLTATQAILFLLLMARKEVAPEAMYALLPRARKAKAVTVRMHIHALRMKNIKVQTKNPNTPETLYFLRPEYKAQIRNGEAKL